jgi:enamine deaminase RidA (YjgF/YER057c/UK114 family)
MSPESARSRKIDVPPGRVAESLEVEGCPVVLRRVEGPAAREVFLHCQPPADVLDASGQSEAIYRAIHDLLEAEGGEAEGGSPGLVVAETVFLRDLPANIEPVRAARERVFAADGGTAHSPATTEIEQPPLNERACLEVMVHAVVPYDASHRIERVEASPICGCAECARAHGLALRIGEETRFHAAGLCGPGETAYEQTHGMFGRAEELLRQAGMEFSDVVRTWIYLREMDRDYGDLNRARREFFEARGIDPVPASTGIGGGPVSDLHDLCLGIYAVKAGHPPLRTVMTSPTLNEAGQYGADFVRGMKMVEANKVALHVSGTASIDEEGRTAHPGDFGAQADRMLLNIRALLQRQDAGVDDVVSAITYLKHPSDTARLRAKLRQAGFDGFPHALVEAPICRPDLLCETEVLAVLPHNAPALPTDT